MNVGPSPWMGLRERRLPPAVSVVVPTLNEERNIA